MPLQTVEDRNCIVVVRRVLVHDRVSDGVRLSNIVNDFHRLYAVSRRCGTSSALVMSKPARALRNEGSRK